MTVWHKIIVFENKKSASFSLIFTRCALFSFCLPFCLLSLTHYLSTFVPPLTVFVAAVKTYGPLLPQCCHPILYVSPLNVPVITANFRFFVLFRLSIGSPDIKTNQKKAR
uniref:(northern house mosquito) hypothetical protein n=1 Tax=Culex pipiens TaxID=7175 RepID=A0A8D8CN16_CULPI